MARGTIPLALPLIRWREVGQFYFGDRSTKWVPIQPALTEDNAGQAQPRFARAENGFDERDRKNDAPDQMVAGNPARPNPIDAERTPAESA